MPDKLPLQFIAYVYAPGTVDTFRHIYLHVRMRNINRGNCIHCFLSNAIVIYPFMKNAGPSLSPFNAWVLSKSLETLAVRMDRHCSNALHLANWLQNHPKVNVVKYPFLPSNAGFAIAQKQMKAGGGMISFELKDDSPENTKRVLSSTKLFSLAESLGGVESLINHPASMTHASIPKEERIKNGLNDSLIRLSVGIEDVDDLIADLAVAIA